MEYVNKSLDRRESLYDEYIEQRAVCKARGQLDKMKMYDEKIKSSNTVLNKMRQNAAWYDEVSKRNKSLATPIYMNLIKKDIANIKYIRSIVMCYIQDDEKKKNTLKNMLDLTKEFAAIKKKVLDYKAQNAPAKYTMMSPNEKIQIAKRIVSNIQNTGHCDIELYKIITKKRSHYARHILNNILSSTTNNISPVEKYKLFFLISYINKLLH